MPRQAAIDRVFARLALFVIASRGAPRPFGSFEAGERGITYGLAVIDDKPRQIVVLIEFLVVVADDNQGVELGPSDGGSEMLDPLLRRGMARGQPLRRQFGGDGGLGTGQQLVIGGGAAVLVEKVEHSVAVDEARPVFGRG